jgi:signal transduction histidine kinase
MRWWLALAFAGIAALTALAVAQVFTARSEAAIRERSQELVAGAAVAAAAAIPRDATRAEVRSRVEQFGTTRQIALFAFAADGSLVTTDRARGVSIQNLPNLDALLATALQGRREVETIDDGRLVTVALPLQREQTAALIAVASRSDLEDALGIVRDEIVSAALRATAIGAVVGLVVALLITRRLRRIAAAAAEIEQGRFDRSLSPRFHDELGALAQTIDRMRQHLSVSFERLEAERDRLERLLEQLQEGVIAVDRELHVEFANSRARALLGSSVEPGRRLPTAWAGEDLEAALHALFEPGAEPQILRAEAEAGQTYVVALLPPASGSRTGVVVVTDVSEKERRERAEREFVTNAAHELRTPLAAIASAVEVLQAGAKEDVADRDRFLEVVERQTTRLTRLAHALLTLARAQTRSERLALEPVHLDELVRDVASRSENVQIDGGATDVDVEVLAHSELLQQALDSLVANAHKHAPDADVVIRVTRFGDEARIDVSDNGPGMSTTDARRASERFYRGGGGERDGFGLGLPIVRESVVAMGGDLLIASRPGEGTTVSIVLPAAATAGVHA